MPQRSGCLFPPLLLAALLMPPQHAGIPLPKMEDIAQYKADGRWPRVAKLHRPAAPRSREQAERRRAAATWGDGYACRQSRRGGAQPPSLSRWTILRLRTETGANRAAPLHSALPAPTLRQRTWLMTDILELGYMSAGAAARPTSKNASVTRPYGLRRRQPAEVPAVLIKFPTRSRPRHQQGSEFDGNHDAQWAHDKWFNLEARPRARPEPRPSRTTYKQAKLWQLVS